MNMDARRIISRNEICLEALVKEALSKYTCMPRKFVTENALEVRLEDCKYY